jgi:hypothetical protein
MSIHDETTKILRLRPDATTRAMRRDRTGHPPVGPLDDIPDDDPDFRNWQDPEAP